MVDGNRNSYFWCDSVIYFYENQGFTFLDETLQNCTGLCFPIKRARQTQKATNSMPLTHIHTSSKTTKNKPNLSLLIYAAYGIFAKWELWVFSLSHLIFFSTVVE